VEGMAIYRQNAGNTRKPRSVLEKRPLEVRAYQRISN
jgi:hypothetical protein